MEDCIGLLRKSVNDLNPALSERMIQGSSAVFAIEGTILDSHVTLSDTFMVNFFKQVSAIKEAVSTIDDNTRTLRSLKREIMLSTTPQSEKEISDNLEKTLRQTNALTLSTKKALENLKKENASFSKENPNSSESRIRENLHQALTRKLRKTLIEYQTVQTDYKQEVKNRVARQVKIVCPEATELETQKMVEEEEIGDIIRAKITGTVAHANLQNALADLTEKYHDIRKLEQNVSELHQLFVDLATLVDAQGELLDQIEFSVSEAKDYVAKADEELVSARKHQKSAQKRTMYMAICLTVVLLCILIPTIIHFTK